jgi:hypothetical protein
MDRLFIIPEWKGSVYEKWAFNYCLRNQWRVHHVIGDMEDLMSQCVVNYLECKQRYGGTINTASQFMALFKLSVACDFNTRSVRDFRARKCATLLLEKKDSQIIYSEAELNTALNESSLELREMMRIFLSAPQEVLDVIRADADKSKQYFNSVAKYCGISISKAKELAVELRTLLVK